MRTRAWQCGGVVVLPLTLIVPACGGDGAGPESGPASVSVTPSSVLLAPGETASLSVAVLDSQGRLLTAVPVEFATSDGSVATVTATGLVTAVAVVPDTATITVRVPPSGPSCAVPVVVQPIIGGIEISPRTAQLRPGATVQFTARVYDIGGTTIPGVPVTFQGRDTRLVTVTSQGLATAGTGWGSTYVVVRYVAPGPEVFADSAVFTVAPIVVSPALSGRPFGLAVSGSGTVYIGRIDSYVLGAMVLPNYDIALGPTVGAVPTDVTFNVAGTTAYVTNQLSQNVGVVDVAIGTMSRTIALGADPFVLALEPGEQRLWVTTNANEVVVIDLSSDAIAARIPVGWAPNGIAFHPAQPSAYVSAAGAGTISKISRGTLSVTKVITLGGALQGLAIAPDGSELYVGDEAGGQLKVVDLATETAVATIPLGGGAFDVFVTPDATRLLVGLPSAGEVVVVDRAARTILGRIRTGGVPRRIGCAADGSICLVANELDWVDVLEF